MITKTRFPPVCSAFGKVRGIAKIGMSGVQETLLTSKSENDRIDTRIPELFELTELTEYEEGG